MRCWCGYLSGTRCRLFEYGPANATGSPASYKSRLVLPPRYWLIQVVLKKRPLTGCSVHTHTHTHTHTFNGPFSGTTRVGQYQKGKTNLDSTEARDSEWQWHHLGHMQVCTLLQTDNLTSTSPLSFYKPDALPAGLTNSVKALKAQALLKVNWV